LTGLHKKYSFLKNNCIKKRNALALIAVEILFLFAAKKRKRLKRIAGLATKNKK
jgi:hypothetical protein